MTNNVTSEDKTWAPLVHLASFVSFIIPFGNVLGPLVIWLMKRSESETVDRRGKEALNFQISMSIYLSFLPLFGIFMFFTNIFFGSSLPHLRFMMLGVTIFAILWALGAVFTIIGAVKASRDEDYNYPFTIRFIR